MERVRRRVRQAVLGRQRSAWLDRAADLRVGFERWGYSESLRQRSPVDAQGRPIPWFTYGAFEYLDALDLGSARVFEYGAGGSTLYWQRRAGSVTAVESSRQWYEALVDQVTPPSELLLRADPHAYVQQILASGDKFDLIVIDGYHRTDCVEPALQALAPGGMIVLDNSDWYPELAERLRHGDLIQVDFAGWGPINHYVWVTSIFLHRAARWPPLGEQPRRSISGLPVAGDSRAVDAVLLRAAEGR